MFTSETRLELSELIEMEDESAVTLSRRGGYVIFSLISEESEPYFAEAKARFTQNSR